MLLSILTTQMPPSLKLWTTDHAGLDQCQTDSRSVSERALFLQIPLTSRSRKVIWPFIVTFIHYLDKNMVGYLIVFVYLDIFHGFILIYMFIYFSESDPLEKSWTIPISEYENFIKLCEREVAPFLDLTGIPSWILEVILMYSSYVYQKIAKEILKNFITSFVSFVLLEI